MELLQTLATGRTTVRDAVGERLALLHELPDAVMAFDDDRALADASLLDRAFSVTGPVGPLHGLPVTVKDWIDVEGFPCAGAADAIGGAGGGTGGRRVRVSGGKCASGRAVQRTSSTLCAAGGPAQLAHGGRKSLSRGSAEPKSLSPTSTAPT